MLVYAKHQLWPHYAETQEHTRSENNRETCSVWRWSCLWELRVYKAGKKKHVSWACQRPSKILMDARLHMYDEAWGSSTSRASTVMMVQIITTTESLAVTFKAELFASFHELGGSVPRKTRGSLTEESWYYLRPACLRLLEWLSAWITVCGRKAHPYGRAVNVWTHTQTHTLGEWKCITMMWAFIWRKK